MPKDHVQAFLQQLLSRDTGMDSFLSYFMEFWMKRETMWMVTSVDGDILTNCALESYHGKLGSALPYAHPHIRRASELLLEMDNRIIATNMLQEELDDCSQKAVRRREEFRRKCFAMLSEANALASQFPMRTLPLPRISITLEEKTEGRDPEIDVPNFIDRLFTGRIPTTG